MGLHQRAKFLACGVREVGRRRRGRDGCERGRRGFAQAARNTMSEHDRFQERIGGQAIGAVRAGRCALADDGKAFERRASPCVRRNAAHVIVRGGAQPG